jgi:hypothetical protein
MLRLLNASKTMGDVQTACFGKTVSSIEQIAAVKRIGLAQESETTKKINRSLQTCLKQ